MDKNSLLLNITRDAIKSHFNPDIKIDKDALLLKYPFLKEQKATFVTLTIDGKLRGCIGSLIAHRTLLEDLISNGKAAAFSDPRFSPLSKDEFNKVKVEISILTQPKHLEYKDFDDLKKKLRPKKDGVILQLGDKRATFLPQVWEQLPTFDEFMVHLCKKAGLNPSSLSSFPTIYTYEVIKIKGD